MPTIGEFLGVMIRMDFNDHAPPHFHDRYNDHEAVIRIEPVEVIEGSLPRRALGLVFDWAELLRAELLNHWELCGATRERIKHLWSRKMRWDVISVEVLPLKTLVVRFADGTEGKVRFEHTHLEGVFAALKNPAVFEQAHVEVGAVAWPDEIDLAADAMYEEIKRSGERVLR